MSAALIAALVFTVALLVVTAYFIMGSVPLLILRHDTPMDGRFVRAFFDTYYRVATFTAAATALSYALAGRAALAAGATVLALIAIALRRKIIPLMDSLRARIEGSEANAIAAFRRTHAAAIAINVVQLALVVGTLISFSIQARGDGGGFP